MGTPNPEICRNPLLVLKSKAHLIEELEGLLHALLVVGVGENAGHGGEELGKVDAAVAVLVPLGHPLAYLVVGDGSLVWEAGFSDTDLLRPNLMNLRIHEPRSPYLL